MALTREKSAGSALEQSKCAGVLTGSASKCADFLEQIVAKLDLGLSAVET